ncbi:UNVERIFIED_CONTAM: hypothetical protein H355_005691 [Colinus virginianus]|nr:hypothetical protein H355_005691 [Colinus virginianus]
MAAAAQEERRRQLQEYLEAKRKLKCPGTKRQLEQWLASKGKCYKRPPMTLPPKKPLKQKKPLLRSPVQEEQKPEKPEQLHLARINALLTECLKLIEEGVPLEQLSAILCHEPTAEKCAKFWICKAKLLTRHGPFDVTGLYEAAVCAGAEVDSALSSLPFSSIKLQVTSGPRARELPGGQELKFLTPVRRSLRIERAGSHYPEMLRDHDPVVSSLSEILDDDKDTRFFFRKNKALPEVAQMGVMSL